jgi:hypothetical protein
LIQSAQYPSLRLVLIIPFVLQLAATVGLVGYLSFRNGQSAVNDLSRQLRSELSSRVEQELKAYFDLPKEINQLNALALTLGELDMAEGTQASQFFQQLRISPLIYAIYCGNSKGEFLGAMRVRDKRDALGIWNANALTGGHQYSYFTDNLGNRIKDDYGLELLIVIVLPEFDFMGQNIIWVQVDARVVRDVNGNTLYYEGMV